MLVKYDNEIHSKGGMAVMFRLCASHTKSLPQNKIAYFGFFGLVLWTQLACFDISRYRSFSPRELFWAYMLYGNLLIELLTILRTIAKSHFFFCFLCSFLLKCSNSFSPFCTLHTHPVHTLSRFPYTTPLINR